MLGSHPDIYCFDELHSYNILRGKHNSIPEQVDSHVVGFKIPRWTESLDLMRIPDMKGCAGTTRFYEHDQILFLFRNPLDVVTSMMDFRVGGSTWLEAYGVGDMKQTVMVDSNARDKYSKELEYIASNSSLAGCGALLWKIKTEAYFKYLKQGLPVLRVDYEQLVGNTQPVMQKVLKSIGCKWNDAVLEHHTKKHPEMIRNGLTVGQTNPQRKVSNSSVGRWRNKLKKEDVEAIRYITDDIYEQLNYYT